MGAGRTVVVDGAGLGAVVVVVTGRRATVVVVDADRASKSWVRPPTGTGRCG